MQPREQVDQVLTKLKRLPPEELREVEDFVDFLARREARTAAMDRLLAIAPALEAAGEPPMSEEEIAAEIKTAHAERRARASAQDTLSKPGRT